MQNVPWSIFTFITLIQYLTLVGGEPSYAAGSRPNILFAISDDQSFAHTSAAGYKAIQTPAFDRIARSGALLRNAYSCSPGCSPSRAALLTGRHCWQIEHAGTHASSFPRHYMVYPDLLESAGYTVGYTGKGWGPGNWKISGRKRNPAGPAFDELKVKEKLPAGISKKDYAGNFRRFLEQRPKDKPFCFWYGGHEPHRKFLKGVGVQHGGKINQVDVPGFLPDSQEIRSDILDYCFEIEHFDKHLGLMLNLLAKSGELNNTLVVVTSDNGMAFPRAKANCYEYGVHLPMAICWPQEIPAQQEVNALVSFIDLAPTFLEAAGIKNHPQMQGRSLLPLLTSQQSEGDNVFNQAVFSARERHSSSRWNNLAYPQRSMRTENFLVIRNFRPERWPAGAPQKYQGQQLGPMHGGYHDIDACPSLSFLIEHRNNPNLSHYLQLAVAKRPAWEIFDVHKDPDCLTNLAVDNANISKKMISQLKTRLENYLTKTGDPRMINGGEIFESYKRYSALRKFPKPSWTEKRQPK